MTAPAAPQSNAVTRWFVPLVLIWAGLLLSAWVYTKKLNEPAQELSLKLAIAFLGVPAFSLLLLLALRGLARRTSRDHSRHGDLLVVWVITFLFCIHSAVLAAAIGMFSLSSAVPIATAILMIGLGPVLGTLEPSSAMGIRTRSTLSSAAVWRKTHRVAGKLFVLAGVCGFSALLFEGRWVVFAAVVPAILAVVFAIIYAARLPVHVESEQSDAEERPSG